MAKIHLSNHVSLKAKHIVFIYRIRRIYRIGEADISCAVRRRRNYSNEIQKAE